MAARVVVATVAVAALVGVGVAIGRLTAPSRRALVPACPSPSYSADGNVSPLFCRVDNPVAVRFYGALLQRLLALGPDASPSQVSHALSAADTTLPEACNVYRLAAWAEHWRFGVAPAAQCPAVSG